MAHDLLDFEGGGAQLVLGIQAEDMTAFLAEYAKTNPIQAEYSEIDMAQIEAWRPWLMMDPSFGQAPDLPVNASEQVVALWKKWTELFNKAKQGYDKFDEFRKQIPNWSKDKKQ